MVIVMREGAEASEIERVVRAVEELGLRPHRSDGELRSVVGVVGDVSRLSEEVFLRLPGVEQVVRLEQPYKLASRAFRPEGSRVWAGPVEVGGPGIVVMAGPCSVESREQLLEAAQAVREAGAAVLRGGAFKPRTSPYSFQGLGAEGLRLLAEARQRTGLPVVTEVMAPQEVELVAEYADVLQVGTRNMQNFSLLKELGRAGKPVLLKRGMSATVEEWLLAAEYVLSHGNPDVILCERGIRTFEHATRNTLDLSAVPLVKRLSHLPVVVDPSHATGLWELVTPMALAAVAAGADGLLVEVHPDPSQALSDGRQSLRPDRLARLVEQADAVAQAVGRWILRPEHVAAPRRAAAAGR
ncbi:MAG: 3-deoxy-7-phosphoheptulonate synthase [Bacillota bacterium]|nr:3-deoxy-7-phosphoheptulonate synthase [Bacillota bacterium]